MAAPLSIDLPGYWLHVGREKPSQFRKRMGLNHVPPSRWAMDHLINARQRLRWVYL